MLRELYAGHFDRYRNTVANIAPSWLRDKNRRFASAVALFAMQKPFPRRTAAAKKLAELKAFLNK